MGGFLFILEFVFLVVGHTYLCVRYEISFSISLLYIRDLYFSTYKINGLQLNHTLCDNTNTYLVNIRESLVFGFTLLGQQHEMY